MPGKRNISEESCFVLVSPSWKGRHGRGCDGTIFLALLTFGFRQEAENQGVGPSHNLQRHKTGASHAFHLTGSTVFLNTEPNGEHVFKHKQVGCGNGWLISDSNWNDVHMKLCENLAIRGELLPWDCRNLSSSMLNCLFQHGFFYIA